MIEGKTYTLYGKYGSTQSYYADVAGLVDEFLSYFSWDEKQMAEDVRKQSRSRRKLKQCMKRDPEASETAFILSRCQEVLRVYTTDIEAYLGSLSHRLHLSDSELRTSREQYYLYMIEIELVNRINRQAFADADYRIALLPYCLKESHSNCRARKDGIEVECKACLENCCINRSSGILRENKVDPYILSRGRVRKLLEDLVLEHGRVGILGMACIAELIAGMRLCLGEGLPVLGIPLDANRCPRWMGTMHETSVDLQALERLVHN
jgi:hypothetical protein